MDKELKLEFDALHDHLVDALHDHLDTIEQMVVRMEANMEDLSDTVAAELRLLRKKGDVSNEEAPDS